MTVARALYRGESQFDFVGGRRVWLSVSAALIVLSIGSLAVRQLDLSLDFTGGVAVQVENNTGADVADVRAAMAEIGLADAKIQLLGDGATIRVQTGPLEPDQVAEMTKAVADVAGVSIAETTVVSVGPTFGTQIAQRALWALVIFLAVVILYIWWRLELKMAIAAIVALFHDLLITFGVYSLFGLEVTPATVVAVLVILGYSLYDTVVVFDKVKEIEIDAQGELTYSQIVNLSLNQVLMRSILTSLTSLIPVGSLLFVGSYLLGATTLREFALALFVGIAAGTYSSIFIASPILASWKETEPQWQRVRSKRATAVETPVSAEVITEIREVPEPVRPAAGTGATPRPPKKRRRR